MHLSIPHFANYDYDPYRLGWGEEVIMDKFPHEYFAATDTRVCEGRLIMWLHCESKERAHDKRIKYAMQKRKQRIRNIIAGSHCIEVEAIIDLFLSFLL